MDERIRRMVAYAAAGRNSNRFGSSVYSYTERKHSNMSETYDYDDGSHFSGAKGGNMYHYGLGSHVQLEVSGSSFSGFDYGSGTHFQGSISGSSVQLYDYGEGAHFNYSV